MARSFRQHSKPAAPVPGALQPPKQEDAGRRRGLDVETKDAYITVTRQLFGSEMTVEERRVTVLKDPVEMARVTVSGGYTDNLGDYKSARYGVTISWPCLPDDREVERCYRHVSGLMEKMLAEEISKGTSQG